MKRDQRGFTIVELLIAVAILSIVVAAVCGFILVGSRSYAAGNSDISVQQEAQLALNQMSDVMIDTTRSVNYAGYDAGGNSVHVLKDAEFTFTPEEKSLIMYNGVVEIASDGSETVTEGNGNKHYHFYWSKDDETLYYAEVDVQPTDVDMTAVPFPDPADADPDADPASTGWYVLAQHVTDFSVDLSQVEEKRVVQLALTFLDGNKEYVTSNNVTIRNKVGVNDVKLDPLNKKKTLSVTPRDSGVIIEPGETYHFSTPKVTGENVADRSVTWSVVSSGSGETQFTDAANGILQVSTHEPAGKITVAITTNAVDSDGIPAECTLEVDIKRVKEIKMAKTYDSDPGNSGNRISPGCTFTITPDVIGYKLGDVCSACGSPDIEIDKAVGNKKNNTIYTWEILDVSAMPGDTTGWNPNKYIDIIEDEPDHATFYVHPDAVTYWVDENGKKIPYSAVIRCMSLLSVTDNDQGRHYDWWVPGAITVDFWEEEGEQAVAINGLLQYGDETLLDEIKEDLSTEGHEYVTCVRVVDNSPVNPEPDRILLYFTIDHSANYRVVPDLFDLDLSRSYTFYIQALDPVSKENHKLGNHHQADSNQEIWSEYINHLNPSKPYGYIGDKYDYRKVYYSVLDKPRAIWDGREKGKDFTLDPINVYSLSPGSGIIKTTDVVPNKYENIWHEARTQEKMTYSVYVGEGDRSQWTPLYVFNSDSMSYEGSTSVGDGVGILNIKNELGNPGDPFFKLENGDRLKLCGNYHIVTGFCYQNISDRTITGAYDCIGWQGFSCDGKDKFELPHEMHHYKFDDTIIHVNINADFTMDINDDWFKGQVNFPLPKEMIKNAALFPNPYDTEWKNTAGSLRVVALQNGSSSGEYKTFAYVGYRYYSALDRWEVEPFEVRFDTSAKKIYTHSYGTYLCDRNGSRWEKSLTKGSSTTEKELMCNVKPFSINDGNDYQAFFPLPTDAGFPFAGGTDEIASYELEYFDNNMQSRGKVSDLTVTCKKNGDEYEIEFLKEEKASKYEPNNHKITVVSYGTYTCRTGQTEWTRKKGYGITYKTDFVPTLRDLKLPDGNTYMMDYPLPNDTDFPFKNNVKIIKCNDEKAYNQINDAYAANAKEPFKDYMNQGIEAEHTIESDGTHTIRFYKKEQIGHRCKTTTYGIYTCRTGQTEWTKKEGYSVTETTDLVINLEGLMIGSTSYMMYFPRPGDDDFPFKETNYIVCSDAYVAYTNIYGDNPTNLTWKGAAVEYTSSEDGHTIRFFCTWDGAQYGTFRWNAGEGKWKKIN